MKILIYGAGVVGCSYGWQLSKAGCDVAVLVRKEQKELVQKDGIRIICSDFREKARKDTDIIFKPTVIDELSSNNDFEYIIVSTNKLQLSTILPSLSKSAGKANVVFFQNNWDVFTEIDKYLKPEQYFFAFPFMVGGGKEDKSIHCAISGLKYSNTPLGEKDGRTTPRVEKLSIILDKANLKPVGLFTWYVAPFATVVYTISAVLIEFISVREKLQKIKVNAAEVPDIIRQIVQAASAKDAEKIVELITNKHSDNGTD